MTDKPKATSLKVTCTPNGIEVERVNIEPPPVGAKCDRPYFYTTIKQREAMDKVLCKMKMKSKERVEAALAAQLPYDDLTPEEQEVYLVEFQNRIDNPSDETKQAYASLAGPGTAPND